MAVKVVYIFLI